MKLTQSELFLIFKVHILRVDYLLQVFIYLFFAKITLKNTWNEYVYLSLVKKKILYSEILALYGLFYLFDCYLLLLDDPGFGPDDPRWIGAWWMGFFLQGILLVIFTIPIALFPRRLPGQKKIEIVDGAALENGFKEMLRGKLKKMFQLSLFE